MSDTGPTVGVGMSVRNGAPYLEDALTAIIGQGYAALDIVICDNASSDSTPDICQTFTNDQRVTYHRFDDDLGIVGNFNRAFHLTSGEFFCWAAHDDRIRPGFLDSCVETLENNPDAAMCVTSVDFINSEGRRVGGVREGPELGSPDLRVRLRSFLRRRGWFLAYGLIRREVLASTNLLQPVAGTDVVLLWEILLRHRLCVVEDSLFEYRSFRGSGKFPAQAVASLTPGATSAWRRFQGFRLWGELWKATAAEDLPHTAQVIARQELFLWFFTRYWRELMYNDLCGEVFIAASRHRWVRMACILAAMGVLRPARSWSTLINKSLRPRLLRTEVAWRERP